MALLGANLADDSFPYCQDVSLAVTRHHRLGGVDHTGTPVHAGGNYVDRQAVWMVGPGDIFCSVGVAGQHQHDATNDPDSLPDDHTNICDYSGMPGTSGDVKTGPLAFAV